MTPGLARLLLVLVLPVSLMNCSHGDQELASDDAVHLSPRRIAAVLDSVFEVVVPRRGDEGLTYVDRKSLPVAELPYRERHDRYFSIGTAFAIGPGLFLSAAHVFQLDQAASERSFFLRARDGRVVAIAKILRYSQYRDLVAFTVKDRDLLREVKPLPTSDRTLVGEVVYTIGDAGGEGIAVRSGQISSYTLEPVAGKWQDLRFSAPASPGNSGGPLVNARGQVVGVVVRKNDSENLNVAVPIAEFRRLPATRAEFFVASVEANVDGEPTRDWRHAAPLPATPDALAADAEASRRRFHLRQWREALAEARTSRFPTDPALADYVAAQTYPVNLSPLTYEGQGGYALVVPRGGADAPGRRGERVTVTSDDGDSHVATVELPPGASIQSYLKHPEWLLDALAVTFGLRRDFGGRKIPIASYGNPAATGRFTDSLGRPWLTAVWRTWYDEGSLRLNCLPTPQAFGCVLDTIATASETYGLQEKFAEYDAALQQISYRGTVTAWRAFLKLGDPWLPKALQNVRLTGQPGRVGVTIGAFKLDYDQPIYSDQSRFFVGVGYGFRRPSSLEVQKLQLEHGPAYAVAEEFALLPEPSTHAEVEHRAAWRELARLGQRRGQEKGAVVRLLGVSAVAGTAKKVLRTVACRGPGSRPTPAVVKTCDAIAGPAKGP